MNHVFFASLIFFGLSASAHPGHHHAPHTNSAKEADASPDIKLIYEDINKEYTSSVKPIFDNKCAACHSNAVGSPWYSKVPGVGWIVEGDRSEAKEHLEISKGFPFAGHGTPREDLDALKEDVEKNSMPPWLYSVMHPSSNLTEAEKKTIEKWVEESTKKLPQEDKSNEHHEDHKAET